MLPLLAYPVIAGIAYVGWKMHKAAPIKSSATPVQSTASPVTSSPFAPSSPTIEPTSNYLPTAEQLEHDRIAGSREVTKRIMADGQIHAVYADTGELITKQIGLGSTGKISSEALSLYTIAPGDSAVTLAVRFNSAEGGLNTLKRLNPLFRLDPTTKTFPMVPGSVLIVPAGIDAGPRKGAMGTVS